MPIEKYTPGRNLLRKSATFVAADIVLTRSTVPETGILRITPTTSSSSIKFKCNYLVLGDYSGQTFTLSFDAREVAEGTYASAIGKVISPRIIVSTAARYASAYATANDKIYNNSLQMSADDVEEWNRYSITGAIPGDLNAGSGVPENTWVISVGFQRAAKTSPIEVKNIKLELGSVGTAWSPAPEDIYPGYTYQIIARNELTVAWNNDIASYTRYYLLQASTLSPPTAPSTNPPPSPAWNDSEPSVTFDSTDSLYFVDLTVFADGTWTYSEVSLSSDYEAAKQAFNQAVAAGSAASDAQIAANDAADAARTADDKADSAQQRAEEAFEEIGNQTENINKKIDDNVGAVQSNLNELTQSVADQLAAMQADYQAMLQSFENNLKQYIEFSETLGLILGAVDSQGTQSDFKTVIDNESMKFMQGDNIVAWISNRQLYINNAIIDSALMIGHYFFSERPDGGISLTWQA